MTVQYQGVWSLASAAQLQSTQRWVTDPLYKNTTLLLQADDAANGAQNNTFLDSSSNAFAITRNGGNPGMTQGTFTPFSLQPGAWSNFLNGSSDFLNIGSGYPASLDLGSGNFTIEGWVYLQATTKQLLLGNLNDSNGTCTFFVVLNNTSASARYEIKFGSSAFNLGAGTLPTNQWVHVCVMRSGTSIFLFENGAQVGATQTYSGSIPVVANQMRVGGAIAGQYPLSGYASNLRMVIGSTVYSTSGFTVPTTPLTAITNTALLTCQSNRFFDSSANAISITTSGTPSVQPFSPFAPQYQWTSSVIGGSGYFDGTGDFLSIAASSAFNFGAPSGNTNDFTIEMWVYPTRSAFIDFESLYSTGGSGTQDQLNLYANGTAVYFDGTNNVASPTLRLNQWNHVAVVRNGASSNNLRVYANGVSGTAVTSTNALGSSVVSPRIGLRTDGLYPYQGYISNVRVVKGTAVYTGAYSPPIAPLTTSGPASSYSSTTNVNTTFTSTNTSLLTNFTNAGIFDGTMKNNLETVGNAQISTAVVKYGSGSMYFDGTTNTYLAQNPATTDLYAFGSGDFTIECWLYLISTSNIRTVYDSRASGTASSATPTIYIDAGTIKYYVSGADRITGIALVTGQWYHVAVCRSATSTRMFINGTQVGSTYSDSTVYINSSRRPFIAGDSNVAGANLLGGYIDDLRITKGIARYTQNFIPPSVALPRQ